eukprot:m51a1_g5079 putative carboxypeptidase a1-like (482) ;mRNA; r:231487-233080
MRTTTVALLLLLALCHCCLGERVRYDGHKIVRVHVGSASTFDALRLLSSRNDEADDTPSSFEVLSHDGRLVLGAPATVRVSPSAYSQLLDSRIAHEVSVEDLQAKIDAVDEGSRARRSADWYEQFHSFDDIVAQLSVLAAAHPGLASVVANVSTSVEGRSIPALRLGRGGAGQNVTVLLSGIHAREWIGPPVLMWSVRGLLEDYAAGRNDARRLLDTQAVYAVPCYNPDGYEYSRSTDRYWRKNRARLANGTVVGVDLNRNWDDGHWGHWSSNSTGDEDYCGTSPFSEPEVRGISRWILSLGSNVRTFVDFHSYASQVLRPYGWTPADCPDEKYLKYVGDTMAHIAGFNSSKGGQDFQAGGCTDSWAYERAGILHSFTVELGGDDFVINATEIPKQGAAVYPAVRFLLGLTASPAAATPSSSSSASAVTPPVPHASSSSARASQSKRPAAPSSSHSHAGAASALFPACAAAVVACAAALSA